MSCIEPLGHDVRRVNILATKPEGTSNIYMPISHLPETFIHILSTHFASIDHFNCFIIHTSSSNRSQHPLLIAIMVITAFFKVALLALIVLPTGYAQCTANTNTANNITPVVTTGWQWSVVASNLKSPRSLAFDPQGRLVMVEAGRGLTAIDLTDDQGICVKEQSRNTFYYLQGVSLRSIKACCQSF